jgi:hypothetical protein
MVYGTLRTHGAAELRGFLPNSQPQPDDDAGAHARPGKLGGHDSSGSLLAMFVQAAAKVDFRFCRCSFNLL